MGFAVSPVFYVDVMAFEAMMEHVVSIQTMFLAKVSIFLWMWIDLMVSVWMRSGSSNIEHPLSLDAGDNIKAVSNILLKKINKLRCRVFYTYHENVWYKQMLSGMPFTVRFAIG
jgi:hypothetical protein